MGPGSGSRSLRNPDKDEEVIWEQGARSAGPPAADPVTVFSSRPPTRFRLGSVTQSQKTAARSTRR